LGAFARALEPNAYAALPGPPKYWASTNTEIPMFKTTIAIAVASAAALGLSACDVKKTQEGSVTLPKFQVEKTKEGDVTVPKYDVTTPDVKVGTTEKTIVVPTVKAEEKTIELPKVEIVTAKEKEQGKK
jgi:hypothetical protein